MSLIHILDEQTINQIAAGEVVERPSAVVKELIENAMDAGASAITAEIKEGGLSLIRITDNGSGIAREDIPLAFCRHATSKIKTAEDLLNVTSLGFRGEALSSIAAVAQVELITKTPASLHGYRYLIEGGEEKGLEEIGCPQGTTIIVRNIFYNTPARRKFLKSATTEASHVSDLMERLMLSHPEISFKFIVNNQVKLQSSGNNNTKDILYQIYGRDVSRELLPVEYTSLEVSVRGFIGKPVINRGNRNFENYFINGRYIKSNIITKAIEEAYRPFMMQHKYPFTSLYFQIDPSLIDVNVHPQKLEVRLKNQEEIFRITMELIRSALTGRELIPKVTLNKQEPVKEDRPRLAEPFEEKRREQQLQTFQTYGAGKQSKESYREGQSQALQSHASNKRSEEERKNWQLQPFQTRGPENLSEEERRRRQLQALHTLAPEKLSEEELQELRSLAQTDNRIREDVPYQPSRGPEAIAGEVGLTGEAPKQNTFDEALGTTTESFREAYRQSFGAFSDASRESAGFLQEVSGQSFGPSGEANMQASLPFGVADTGKEEQPKTGELQINAGEQLSLFKEDQTEGQAHFLSRQAMEGHRIIGQVFSTFWLVEYQNDLYIIDQHAAHEKVLYERILAAAKRKENLSQQLLPPIVLTLTLREQEVLKQYEEVLTGLGYEFEHFGGNEFSVRAVPADLYGLSEKELIQEFLDAMADEIMGHSFNIESIQEKTASLSCKAAVKANHTLSEAEARTLIKELLTLENPYHCPHGRPVIISMSRYELEKKFKRIL
jgi:DNA mismatch repair protein MutL